MPPTNYIWMRTNLKKELIGVYEWIEGKWRLIRIKPDGEPSDTYTREEIDTWYAETKKDNERENAFSFPYKYDPNNKTEAYLESTSERNHTL